MDTSSPDLSNHPCVLRFGFCESLRLEFVKPDLLTQENVHRGHSG